MSSTTSSIVSPDPGVIVSDMAPTSTGQLDQPDPGLDPLLPSSGGTEVSVDGGLFAKHLLDVSALMQKIVGPVVSDMQLLHGEIDKLKGMAQPNTTGKSLYVEIPSPVNMPQASTQSNTLDEIKLRHIIEEATLIPAKNLDIVDWLADFELEHECAYGESNPELKARDIMLYLDVQVKRAMHTFIRNNNSTFVEIAAELKRLFPSRTNVSTQKRNKS